MKADAPFSSPTDLSASLTRGTVSVAPLWLGRAVYCMLKILDAIYPTGAADNNPLENYSGSNAQKSTAAERGRVGQLLVALHTPPLEVSLTEDQFQPIFQLFFS